MAKNKVIAGDYIFPGKVSVTLGTVYISTGFSSSVAVTKENIEAYVLVTDEHRKSAASGISRGIVGGALLGPVGLLAGLSAKSKGTYTVAIKFKDGKSCLVEVDDKIYKTIVKKCF